MSLVERNEAISTLRELFADCLRRRSRLAIISGDIATGKSTLLHSVERNITQADGIFLNAVASPLESNLSGGILEQLLRSPELPLDSLERAAQLLNDDGLTSPVRGSAPDLAPGQPTVTCLRGLWDLLHELTERRPVVIGIDSAHYADETSLQCLLYLVRRLRSAQLLTILTECPRPQVANTQLQNEFLREPQACQIRLEALSPAGVATLLFRHLDERTARHLAHPVHAASAGHPSLVHALIEDQIAGPKLAEPRLISGEAFGRAMDDFLRRHEYPVLEVARAVAIMNKPVPLRLLSQLIDVDAGSIARSVGTLTSAGMLHEGRFRHNAVKAAVVDGIPVGTLRVMHDRAAELLHSEGAASTEVAAHIVAANRHGSSWAIPILQEAAEHALTYDDLSTGIRYLRTAYRMCRNRRQRVKIAAPLADAEWLVDPSAVLRRLPEFKSAVHEDLIDGCRANSPVTCLLWHGRVSEALSLLKELGRRRSDAPANGIRTAPDLTPPQLWLCYLYPGLIKDQAAIEATSAPHESQLKAINPERYEAVNFITKLCHENEADALAAAERVLERSRLNHHTFAAISVALITLIYNDRLTNAMTWCDSLLTEAAARHSPTWRAIFTAVRSLISVRQGDLIAAEAQAGAALKMISLKSWGVTVGLSLSTLILARTALGRLQSAAYLLDIEVPDAMFRTPLGLHYLYARGCYYLATQRNQAALRDFRTCDTVADNWAVNLPEVEPWRLGAARALIALNDPPNARELITAQLTVAGSSHLRTRGMALQLQATTGCDPKERVPLLEEAVDLLQHCGDRLALSHALADLSEACTYLGEHARGRALAHRAYALGQQCRGEVAAMPPAGDNGTANLIKTTGGSPPATPFGKLSDAEHRVAALAAEGYSNREISKKLYITISTVEQHLTRVYRKLEVRRFDLKSALQHPR